MQQSNTQSNPTVKHEDYADPEIRYESFSLHNWPLPDVSIDNLAQAGFFYEGRKDEVHCFHCGGKLDKWIAEHQPWLRHVSNFPNCPFLKLNAEEVSKSLLRMNEALNVKITSQPRNLTRSSVSLQQTTSTPENVIPDLIDRSNLKVGKKLGEGGFGAVFLGYWSASLCAIKKVNIAAGHRVNQEQLKQEARIQSALRHPHIVNCFGISIDEKEIWMVMELIKGCGLNDFINNSTNVIPPKYKMPLCLQMCDAIRYLHDDKGIVHNDIKPQNVLIQQQNGRYTAYISDFGISRYIGIEYHDFVSNYTKNCVGTFQYMAPECLKRMREVRSRRQYPKPTFKSTSGRSALCSSSC